MTEPIENGYLSKRCRNQAAENIQEAERKMAKTLERYRFEPGVMMELMAIRVHHLNALRLLERDGAQTIPPEL